MRGIVALMVGFGLSVMACGATAAQDVAKAIQVVIGADGSIQVIDAKTGKVLATQPAPQKPDEARQRLDQARKEIEKALEKLHDEEARKKVEDALKYLCEKQPPPVVRKGEVKPGTDGKPNIMMWQRRVESSAGVEQKLDLILKQLDELRKDVDGIKKSLGTKSTPPAKKPGAFEFEFKLPAEKKKVDADLQKRLDELLKKANLPGEKDKLRIQILPLPDGRVPDKKLLSDLDGILKKLEANTPLGPNDIENLLKKLEAPPAARPALPPADLQRRIDQLMQEVESLRRQIEKTK